MMSTAKKILLFAAICCSFAANAQSFGISTNALGWGTLTPNAGLNVGLAKHWSAEINAGINPFTWNGNRSSRFWAVQPELRYWFNGKFAGPSIGLHGTYGMYDFGLWKYIYDGTLYGGGLSVNYAWPLGERWNLELNLGGGFTRLDHRNRTLRTDPLSMYGPASIDKWGITRVGLTFTRFFGRVNPDRSAQLAARSQKAAERRWNRPDYRYFRDAMTDAMRNARTEMEAGRRDTVVIVREVPVAAPEAETAHEWKEVPENQVFDIFFERGSDRTSSLNLGTLFAYLYDPSVVSYVLRLTARCSPEGGTRLNDALARNRAARICDQLAVAGIPAEKIEVVAKGEDWNHFLQLVAEAPLTDASRVLDILRNETDHALALAKAGKSCPEDWKIVVDSVFPKMRNVTVVVNSIRKVEK